MGKNLFRMAHSVESHLKVTPAEYDLQIQRFIPGYSEMLDGVKELLTYVALANNGRLSVTELGVGTGSLTALLAAAFPDARFDAVDCDVNMLTVARERLELFGSRVNFCEERFEAALKGERDSVVASLALHHVRERSAKVALYAKIREGTKRMFINADALMDSTGPVRDFVYDQWIQHMVSAGISREQAIAHFEEWQIEDRYYSLREELEMLREAGFSNADIAWRRGPMAIVYAIP
jgi:tRNA (cmo5U34)-methyltransferase